MKFKNIIIALLILSNLVFIFFIITDKIENVNNEQYKTQNYNLNVSPTNKEISSLTILSSKKKIKLINSQTYNLNKFILNDNLDGCYNLNSTYFIQNCINIISYSLSEKKLNPNYCDLIKKTNFNVDACKKHILSLKIENLSSISECEKFKDEEISKNCKKKLSLKNAIKEREKTYCNDSVDPKFCEDEYSIKIEFFSNIENFNCNSLHNNFIISDCLNYQKNLTFILENNNVCENVVQATSLFCN